MCVALSAHFREDAQPRTWLRRRSLPLFDIVWQGGAAFWGGPCWRRNSFGTREITRALSGFVTAEAAGPVAMRARLGGRAGSLGYGGELKEGTQRVLRATGKTDVPASDRQRHGWGRLVGSGTTFLKASNWQGRTRGSRCGMGPIDGRPWAENQPTGLQTLTFGLVWARRENGFRGGWAAKNRGGPASTTDGAGRKKPVIAGAPCRKRDHFKGSFGSDRGRKRLR